MSVPSQPSTPKGQASAPPPRAPSGVEEDATRPAAVTAPLETGVQAMAISDPPKLPDSLTPAPVTVVRSPPSHPTNEHHPSTFLPSATPPTSLPGMPAQQFGSQPTPTQVQTTQMSQLPNLPTGITPYQDSLPSAPPTISLPTMAPTISLGPAPNLIPTSSV